MMVFLWPQWLDGTHMDESRSARIADVIRLVLHEVNFVK